MHMVLIRFATYLLSFLIVPIALNAASDEFIVRSFVGTETNPPSIPSSLTATPVAMTQINLNWASSTDDFLLSGYHVYRDGSRIATTTVTTYEDVGLAPSTTYAYYVTAFDYFNNVSASSSVVATTTFATPTVPVVIEEDGGTTYGSRARLPELISLEVVPALYGAVIRYETDSYVRSVVRWGKTISYELGSSRERSFARQHEVFIEDLTPGTRYRFSIEGEESRGRFGVLAESSFLTLPLEDVYPPGNVSGLRADIEGRDVTLSWVNPYDADFDHVRVVRSELFYPTDEVDGWVVYDGAKTVARDEDIIDEGKTIFYTVFSYDQKGNVSSGAVISVRTNGGEVTIVDTVDETKNEIALNFEDIHFYQNGERVSVQEGVVHIDGAHYLTIEIPYGKLPTHLKTILVTMVPQHDTTKKLDFLLRSTTDKTAYRAYLAPLGVAGNFALRVSVFDFKTAQIGYAQGIMTSRIYMYADQTTSGIGAGLFTWITTLHSKQYVVPFVIFLIALALLARKLMYNEQR